MKEIAKTAVQLLMIGALVAVGMRGAEWIIPAPEMRVVICLASEIAKVEVCKPLADYVGKK